MRRPTTLFATAAGCLLAAFIVVLGWKAVPGTSAAAQEAQHIEGAWYITLTAPPNPFVPSQIRMLSNVMRDGNVMGITDMPNLPIAPDQLPLPFTFPTIKETIGHGEWRRTAQGTFRVEIWRMALCAQPAGCVIPGLLNVKENELVGYGKGVADFTIDGKAQTLTGTEVLVLLAPDLTTPLLPPLNVTMSGYRLVTPGP